MQTRTTFTSAGSAERQFRVAQRRLHLLLFLLAAVGFSLASYFAWLRFKSSPAIPLQATAAAWLFIASLAQTRLAWCASRRGDELFPIETIRRRLALRWFLVGAVVSYAASLLTVSPRTAPYLFSMLMSAVVFAAQFPLLAPPQAIRRMMRLLSIRSVRAAGWTAYLILLAPLAAELGLRTYSLLDDSSTQLAFVANRCKLLPGTHLRGQRVNSRGYWDEEFDDEITKSKFRIVAIGDDLILGGNRQTNFLTCLESRNRELEVFNLGIPNAGPREYAALARREINEYRPDLVLLFVSVATDITEELPLPGLFECRSLHTVRFGFAHASFPFAEPTLDRWQAGQRGTTDQQAYLIRSTGRIAVCRSPIDRRLHKRWHVALGYLDEVIADCRAQGSDVAMVIAPGDFQISRNLCRTLCRRDGCPLEQIDLELPQRRLLAFAQRRQTPMLDLMPHMARCDDGPFERNQSSLSESGNAAVAGALGHWLQLQYAEPLASQSARAFK